MYVLSKASSHSCLTDLQQTSSFRFLSLPREVRDMIYSFALVVGTVWPYRQSQRRDYESVSVLWSDGSAAPNIWLLFTCRQIHDEAEPLLYKRNMIELPILPLTARFFIKSLHNTERCSWVKNVFLSLTHEDLTRETACSYVEPCTQITRFCTGSDYLCRAEYCVCSHICEDIPHDLFQAQLHTWIWPSKTKHVLDKLKLDRLIVCFCNSICMEQCCNMEGDALMSFKSGFVHGMPREVSLWCDDEDHEELEVCLGWADNKEKAFSDTLEEWTRESLNVETERCA